MRGIPRLPIVTFIGIAVLGITLYLFSRPRLANTAKSTTTTTSPSKSSKVSVSKPYPGPGLVSFPDPTAPPGSSARVFLEPQTFDGFIPAVAGQFTDKVRDESSLREYREAITHRTERALSQLREKYAQSRFDPVPTLEQSLAAIPLLTQIAFVALYSGDHDEAAAWLKKAQALANTPGVPDSVRAHVIALLGINALRKGEEDNCIGCVGPSSCIFPIAREGVHQRPAGSREAMEWFTAYLNEWPGDLRVRWLLNIAAMTLGEYPDKVPAAYRIPIDPFRSKRDFGRFKNIATEVGLIARGPDLAGGCAFDDFTGDGRPDLFVSSFDVAHGASLYVNDGKGGFEERSQQAGLADQVYSLNVTRADYDNDGRLDVLLLRGAWERPAPMSLLRNKGEGVFEDVTASSGLKLPLSTESAAWGDYDNDGRLDLFVCGEYRILPASETTDPASSSADPRNRCRLYHNQGDGTFVDVAEKAGVQNERYTKGSAWGDYDNDGWIDLLVSNMEGPARLYRNQGNGTFTDVAPEFGIIGPPHGFTCMFWDYDDDGRLDIFIADYSSNLAEVVADFLGLPVRSDEHAHVYHNLPTGGFREVSREVGLARPMPCMSVNAGDIDNDGDLDLYLGTGWMSLSGLIPDLMYVNNSGRFEDVTESTGTGHLQKGHGVSFADWDDDGDLDLFSVLGGGYPGDKGYNALFGNPGHGHHWLKIRLIGKQTNRSAIGARIEVEVKHADGAHTVRRFVGNNGSFGGNPLIESIGLKDATSIERVSVTWPVSKTTQTFRDVRGDQEIEIIEGADSYRTVTRKPSKLSKG